MQDVTAVLPGVNILDRVVAGVPFARNLKVFGGRLAVVTPDGDELTYDQLADRVSEVVERLGRTGRRLVLVAASNEVDPLVTYLAALTAGHPVLLTAPGNRHGDTLVSTYDPDVVLYHDDGGGWQLRERRPGSAHVFHPDLAVLLSTSGSTGSAKLVRLSAQNIQANAESIAVYLGIRDTDRAAAMLPMHYCYGLSIINSNLLRGAAVVLTNDSVVETRFWAAFRRYGCTSLHGVPYTFDLLDRVGFETMDLPSLRYVTQAGGALGPRNVRHFAELGARRGWQLFVMYGQTEATARMAYLPPELAASHPSAIGVPIPGGQFEILPSDTPGQGELVYRGPNVMLGYAERPADLALGRTVDVLATGDVARRVDGGLYELVGRKARFIKLFGLRIDLARIEQVLAAGGHAVACTGSDDALVVATEAVGEAARRTEVTRVTEMVRAHLGLPASHLRVVAVDDLPRLPSGKIDYPEVRRLATPPAPESAIPAARGDGFGDGHGRGHGRERGHEASVRARFAKVLAIPDDIPDDATFVRLGGDSLSYVQMSIEIERVLGYVPADWHTTPVGELDRLALRHGRHASRHGRHAARHARTPFAVTAVETNIVLRVVAITLVVGTHINLFQLYGGAHVLLVLAGWSFARFSLGPRDTGTSSAILRSTVRIAVPAVLVLSLHLMSHSTHLALANLFLINNYVHTGALEYWFIEVMVHTLVVFAVLFAIPPVRRLEQRHGFAFASAVMGVALLAHLPARLAPLPARESGVFPERLFTTHDVLWFFVLGWLAYRAKGAMQKAVVVGVAVLMMPGYFGEPLREAIVLVGVALLIFVPRMVLPRFAVGIVGLIASASLYIYLTHFSVFDRIPPYLPTLAVLPACFAVGVVTWAAVQHARTIPRTLARAVRSRGATPSPT